MGGGVHAGFLSDEYSTPGLEETANEMRSGAIVRSSVCMFTCRSLLIESENIGQTSRSEKTEQSRSRGRHDHIDKARGVGVITPHLYVVIRPAPPRSHLEQMVFGDTSVPGRAHEHDASSIPFPIVL